MRHLVFLLEGPSEKEALEAWVPTLLPPGVQSHFIVFEGKQDMERRMALKLRHWMQPDSRFIVLRDQDSADCTDVKAALLARCTESGRAADCIVRIACHELESFFLGDCSMTRSELALVDADDLYPALCTQIGIECPALGMLLQFDVDLETTAD